MTHRDSNENVQISNVSSVDILTSAEPKYYLQTTLSCEETYIMLNTPKVKISILASLLVVISGAAAQAETFSGYYKFQTQFLEKENKCLEGNKVAEGSTLEGAAFMDNCQNVTGQTWKFVPASDGYYRLQTQFLEKENKCLEGNKFDPSSTLKGAAFMDNCQNVTGQMWKPVDAGNGYYRLQTQFLEKENKCLEGNKFDPSSTLKGAAFMDNCQNVTGQMWKFVKVDG